MNIFTLDDSHLAFYVLDVSGHGVSASLLSVAVHRLLTPQGPSSLLRRHGECAPLPSEVLMQLNEQFAHDESEQYFTLFFGVLDLGSMVLTYANAGHPGPGLTYDEGPWHFQPGDLERECHALHFWSMHPQGAYFARGDASIHFMNYASDSVLPGLATRFGGD